MFYRVSKDGYYPTYGSSTVTISQASATIGAVGESITYGERLENSQLNASAVWDSTELEGEFSWVNGSTIYPAVSDSQSTLYTVRFTPTDTVNFKTVEKNIKVTVNKADQETPNDIASVNETYLNQANGQILYVNDKMEYCRSGEDFVSVPTGKTILSGLAAGNYQVRYKGDANHNPSPVKSVTIAAGKKVDITLPDNQVGYSLTASEKSVAWNQEVTIQFEVEDGYSATQIPAVKLNGTALNLIDGKATVAMKEDAVLTVSGVKDITAPTGDITFNSNSVKTFINTISFGLFFKDSVDVKITAEDAGSGIASIQYIRSTSVMTEEAVRTSTAWKTYETISEVPSDAEKFVYYVKITDKAGNVTYIGSNGATFDTTAPAITGVTNGATCYTTQKVIASDINLLDISLNGSSTENPVMLAGNTNATYIITATDKVGNETIYTVTMKTISDLSALIDSITVENVKSSDKSKIEEVKSAVTGEDIANATNEEKDALRAITDKCDELLAKIDDAFDATEKQEIKDVETINKDNVKLSDKDALAKAKVALDATIKDFDGNYTETELVALKAKLANYSVAINAIENAENVASTIASLPETANIKTSDKDAINAAKAAYDALTDNEKAMVGAEYVTKLNAAMNALAELGKGDNAPRTGDTSNIALWFALLFVSGGVLSGFGIRKKRKQNSAK